MGNSIEVDLNDLTDRQVHLHLIKQFDNLDYLLERIERFMAGLDTSVSALQEAIDRMAIRFNAQNQVLTTALDNANQALAAAESVSEADKASLEAALNEINSAKDAIDAEVVELNGIGAEPDVPVEDVPVEELPAPPSEDPPTEETSTQDSPAEETPTAS